MVERNKKTQAPIVTRQEQRVVVVVVVVEKRRETDARAKKLDQCGIRTRVLGYLHFWRGTDSWMFFVDCPATALTPASQTHA
jgi:hypothetical protein